MKDWHWVMKILFCIFGSIALAVTVLIIIPLAIITLYEAVPELWGELFKILGVIK